MLTWEKRQELAEQFSPRLVIFPEMQELGRPGLAVKLTGDYYPRTVQLLLERSVLARGWFGQSQSASLDRLAASNNPSDELILLGQILGAPERAWQSYFEIIGDKVKRENRFPTTTYARVQTRGEAIAATAHAPGLETSSLPAPDEVGRPLYKRENASEDDIAIQYWFCYYFDDWANQHEGDWEGVCIFLHRVQSDYVPVGASYYAHETGKRRHWSEVERATANGTHPLVYVAAGSHASYFQYVDSGFFASVPGFVIPFIGIRLNVSYMTTRVDRVPNAADFPPIVPNVALLPDPVGPADPNDPAWENKKWLGFPGAWGVRILGRLGHAGPTGPSHKGLKWHDPFAWMERYCSPDYLVY